MPSVARERSNPSIFTKKRTVDFTARSSRIINKLHIYLQFLNHALTHHARVHSTDVSFRLQVRVPGFDFIGCGDGRSKKDAQGLAAKSFAQFLVDQHLVPASAIVSLAVGPQSSFTRWPLHTFHFYLGE